MTKGMQSSEFMITVADMLIGLGVVIYGCVTDSWQFAGVGALVLASATHPYIRGRAMTKAPRPPVAPPRSA